jgi:hypothetical protein
MARPLADELAAAREALGRGFPEEALDRLDGSRWRGAPEDVLVAARELRDEARAALRRPAAIMAAPTPEALAARRRAMIAVYVVTAVTAVTGLVAAVLVGLTS